MTHPDPGSDGGTGPGKWAADLKTRLAIYAVIGFVFTLLAIYLGQSR